MRGHPARQYTSLLNQLRRKVRHDHSCYDRRMSAIRLVNAVSSAADASSEFRVFQGQNQLAHIGVHAGGMASVPTSSAWQVQGSTTLGDFSMLSNPVTIAGSSANVIAQVLAADGFYDFQLIVTPGSMPSAIVAENTWRNPVSFTFTQPGTPVQMTLVVDEHNNATVSTAQQWTIYAIVNGITTQSVMTSDPNATITLAADNNDDGFSLVVS